MLCERIGEAVILSRFFAAEFERSESAIRRWNAGNADHEAHLDLISPN